MKDWESTCQIKKFGYSAALGFILSSSPSTLMFYKGTGLVPEKILRPECSLSLDLSLPALSLPLLPHLFTPSLPLSFLFFLIFRPGPKNWLIHLSFFPIRCRI